MLRIDNQNINFNGASMAGEDMIATFGAGYSGNDIYINVNIPTLATYTANKATFESDLIAFKDQVIATIEDLQD